MEFDVGDTVFAKTLLLKHVVWFRSKEKLSPRLVGLFPIVKQIGKVAYRLELPKKMSSVDNVFHVTFLWKCVLDSNVVVSLDQYEDLEVESIISRPRKPLRVAGIDTKQLRRKVVKLVKVQWSEDESDCTWETEEDVRKKYPELFVW